MQGLAEITLQLRHGWRRSLITLILFTGQPGFLCCELIQLPWLRWVCHTAYFYFLTIWALEGCLASFHFHNSDESHRSFQGSGAGDLWGPTLDHVSGYWRVSSHGEGAHCLQKLSALQGKGMLSLKMTLAFLPSPRQGLYHQGPRSTTLFFVWGDVGSYYTSSLSSRMLWVSPHYKGCEENGKRLDLTLRLLLFFFHFSFKS